MDQQDFQRVWDLELERARQMVDSWTAEGSEDLLIEKILEQEELDREQVQESVRLATQVAVESLAKLQVLKAQLQQSQPSEQQDLPPDQQSQE
jgi:hypothetical protein